MDNIHKKRSTCRLCDSQNLQKVLSLAPSPPANAYVDESALTNTQESFPLDVYFCKDCSHVQLLDVLEASTLFSDYVYVSGTSKSFVKHFEDYAKQLIEKNNLKEGDLVIDIGSNDGTFLRFFKDAGMRVLGIDPAKKIASAASENGIETLPEFFTTELADDILSRYGKASLVTGNNVFAHIDDINSIVKGIKKLLDKNGVLTFEVSYLVDVYEKILFDTIYHEHLDYHKISSLNKYFLKQDMQLIDAERVDSHGGSIRISVKNNHPENTISDNVKMLEEYESNLGLNDVETYMKFSSKIDVLRNKLSDLVNKIKEEGKTIAGYGAPAKATTLMHHFHMDDSKIDFIVDDNPLKQGLYTPGTHIPILPSSAIYDKKPDYLLILAWNFSEPIMSMHRKFSENGGHFIVPLPLLTLH